MSSFSLETLLENYGNPDKGYIFLGSGISRRVFLCPDKETVVKIPVEAWAQTCNSIEEYNCHLGMRNEEMPQVAPCRVERVKGGKVLFMERVAPMMTPGDFCTLSVDEQENFLKGLPWWVNEIDCFQVGRDKTGKIVAFDAGNRMFDKR